MERRPNLENELSSRSSSKTSNQTTAKINFFFLSLFPEVFDPFLKSSLLGKAQDKGLVRFHPIQLRNYSEDKHRTVDDSPYGGGEGMLLRIDVLDAAIRSIPPSEKSRTVLLSPQGKVFNQAKARELSKLDQLILVCGHYEGVDERFIESHVDEEISIGDYVLTGGELPALILADSVARLLPGVVGNPSSVEKDSLENGLLKHPQYTRPREYQGREVPEVLLSGDHARIASWRKAQSLERTRRKRPDLLDPETPEC